MRLNGQERANEQTKTNSHVIVFDSCHCCEKATLLFVILVASRSAALTALVGEAQQHNLFLSLHTNQLRLVAFPSSFFEQHEYSLVLSPKNVLVIPSCLPLCHFVDCQCHHYQGCVSLYSLPCCRLDDTVRRRYGTDNSITTTTRGGYDATVRSL